MSTWQCLLRVNVKRTTYGAIFLQINFECIELSEAHISAAYEQCPSTSHNRALHWNIGNAGSWAHLRVQYDDVGFARVMDRLKANRDDFAMEDRMELIGDELALLK
uniref:Uncharacterized protein n=1 Tax=Parascaris equorum TaxID=6256 RepID=A0A914R2S1_PAREQ